MTHTPGPWIASKHGYQVLTGDGWNSVCELRGEAAWKNGMVGDQEANSRLIASSPTLLSALCDLVRATDMRNIRGLKHVPSMRDQQDAIASARKAIEMARGGVSQ